MNVAHHGPSSKILLPDQINCLNSFDGLKCYIPIRIHHNTYQDHIIAALIFVFVLQFESSINMTASFG